MKIDKSEIIKGFTQILLWLSCEDGGETYLDENYDIDDVSKESMTIVEQIVDRFIKESKLETLEILTANSQVGHDLYLTMNGHGTGFWDRPHLYPNNLHNALTDIVKEYPCVNGYVENGVVGVDGWQMEIKALDTKL